MPSSTNVVKKGARGGEKKNGRLPTCPRRWRRRLWQPARRNKQLEETSSFNNQRAVYN